DGEVTAATGGALLVAAAIQPVSGLVFVLDGVLIGAGDGVYLAWAGLAVLIVYTPLALAAGLGDLVWLWLAYGAFMVARLVTLYWRQRGNAWVVLGAPPAEYSGQRGLAGLLVLQLGRLFIDIEGLDLFGGAK